MLDRPMSKDDVTVPTDRDREAAYNIAKNWSDHPTDLAEEIAQSLAQARSEGAAEVQALRERIYGRDHCSGNPEDWGLLSVVEGISGQRDIQEARADRAERCLQEQHEATDALWNERHALQQRADAAEEALRVARGALEPFANLPLSKITIEHVTNATRAYNGTPTTASTKTAQEKPEISKIRGSDPDFTGGMTTAEYLDEIRGTND